MKHLMIDIETMSLASNAAIVSMAAIDVMNPDVFFYETIDPSFYKTNREFDINEQTMQWWNKQDISIREDTFNGTERLDTILFRFKRWLTQYVDWSNLIVWANGVTFDISILEHAYRDIGTPPPWKYYNVCDYRTLKRIMSHVALPAANPRPHHALEDARYQAAHLRSMLACIEASKVLAK